MKCFMHINGTGKKFQIIYKWDSEPLCLFSFQSIYYWYECAFKNIYIPCLFLSRMCSSFAQSVFFIDHFLFSFSSKSWTEVVASVLHFVKIPTRGASKPKKKNKTMLESQFKVFDSTVME